MCWPKLSTVMRSLTDITRFMSCSISSSVVPRSRMLRSSATSVSVSAGFIPAAGSSRSSRRGSLASARALSTRRWSPYGKLRADAPATCSSPTKCSSSSARARVSRSSRAVAPPGSSAPMNPTRVRTWRPIITFSTTLRSPKRRMFWNVRATPSRAIACAGRPAHAIARLGVARTFQNIRLFGDLSVVENVMIGRHVRTRVGFIGALLPGGATAREERETRARALELLHFVGLEHVAGASARSLPYGDQRRVEIARALASEPRLLLLDEPAAGMNPAETDTLVALLRSIRERGTTLLLIEHDMNLVMSVSDRITVLNFGQHIAEGVPVEIARNPDVITAYLGGTLDAA